MELLKCKVGDIATITAGGDRPAVCSDKRTERTMVPIYSNGLEKDGLYGYTDVAKVEGDTVTVSARGVNIGTVCYRTEPFTPIVRLLCLVPNRELINAKYLYYNLKNTHISGTGSAQPQVTVPMISNVAIEIHKSLKTQEKIANFLSTFDDAIANNNAIIIELTKEIEVLFRAWFISFEQFSDCLIDGPLGRQPKGWNIKTLAEVTINIRDRVGKTTEGIRVLSAVNTGNLTFSDDYFSKQVFSKDISKYIVVAENDFAYNPARVNIGSIGINDLGVMGCVSPVYVVFRVEEGYEYYFSSFIKSKRFKKEVVSRATGSVRQSMNYSDFGKIELVYPPREVIDQYNELVKPVCKMIKEKKDENYQLSLMRDKLIPAAMSNALDISAI